MSSMPYWHSYHHRSGSLLLFLWLFPSSGVAAMVVDRLFPVSPVSFIALSQSYSLHVPLAHILPPCLWSPSLPFPRYRFRHHSPHYVIFLHPHDVPIPFQSSLRYLSGRLHYRSGSTWWKRIVPVSEWYPHVCLLCIYGNGRVTKCLWSLAMQARSSMRIYFHGWWSMMLRRSRWMHERTTIRWPSEDIMQRQSRGSGCIWNRDQFRMISRVAQCLVNHGNDQHLAQRNKGNRGRGTRKRVSSHVKLPGNWKNVLRNDDNKDELFLFLGQTDFNNHAYTKKPWTAVSSRWW